MPDYVLKVVNGWAILPAALQLPTTVPRFNLQFPANLAQEGGARHLVINESQGGYELATRNLLEKVLRPGDCFVDVGAHWGIFTLQAATHPAGNIRVIAFEPDPTNAAVLFRNIVTNQLTEVAQLVCAACGEGFDLAPLVSYSSMLHSIHGVALKSPEQHRGPPKWVTLVSLDAALAYFPQAGNRRLILKVDAEGFEPQVLAGARHLLASGRVALIVWERGYAFDEGAERSAMIEMVALLTQHGFRHFRPPAEHVAGQFIPFHAEDPYNGNVFSVGAGLNV